MGSYCCSLVVDFSQNDTNAVDVIYFMASHMRRWSSLPPGWGRVEHLEAAFLRCLTPGMIGLLRLTSHIFV
jgi:hypothetical protein